MWWSVMSVWCVFEGDGDHRDLHGLTHSFPTRRSSDLSDWSPVPAYPPTRIVRFTEKYLRQGTEHHKIAGVDVPSYSAAKTLADLFRNGRDRKSTRLNSSH